MLFKVEKNITKREFDVMYIFARAHPRVHAPPHTHTCSPFVPFPSQFLKDELPKLKAQREKEAERERREQEKQEREGKKSNASWWGTRSTRESKDSVLEDAPRKVSTPTMSPFPRPSLLPSFALASPRPFPRQPPSPYPLPALNSLSLVLSLSVSLFLSSSSSLPNPGVGYRVRPSHGDIRRGRPQLLEVGDHHPACA